MEPEQNVTPQDVLWQLRAIAMADMTRAVAVEDGQLCVRDTGSLPAELRAAVCAIEKSPGGLKLKFYDKLKALELLGRMLGLFEQRTGGEASENDLLQTILDSTKEVIATNDIPEFQQAAAAGDDVVEPSPAAGAGCADL